MHVPLLERVIKALHKFEQESKSDEHSDSDPIDDLITVHGWEPIRDTVLAILHDRNYVELWEIAINAIYPSVSDRKPLDDNNDFIALMYACWKEFPGEQPDDYMNTIWTLVITLKRLSYNTEYEPLDDPAITSTIEKILEQRNQR